MSTKLRLAIVAILLAMDVALAASPSDKASGTGGSKNTILASSKRYEAFERKLSSSRSLSENATVATQTARSLFQMGKSAPPSLGGLVLEASCAAFIACGADASYADARKALGNPKDFESRVLDCCQICGGRDGSTRIVANAMVPAGVRFRAATAVVDTFPNSA